MRKWFSQCANLFEKRSKVSHLGNKRVSHLGNTVSQTGTKCYMIVFPKWESFPSETSLNVSQMGNNFSIPCFPFGKTVLDWFNLAQAHSMNFNTFLIWTERIFLIISWKSRELFIKTFFENVYILYNRLLSY